jgi:hypothetical protein
MLTLAWETDVVTPAMKCLLACLADHHNDETGLCFPSISRLAKRTSMSRRAVIDNTKKLVDVGFVSVKKNPGDGRGAKSNKYTLHLGQSEEGSLPPKVKMAQGKVKMTQGKVKEVHPNPYITIKNNL